MEEPPAGCSVCQASISLKLLRVSFGFVYG